MANDSLYWNELSWTDLQRRLPDVVLLPVGSVEAHGPHLPVGTDSIISEEWARRSARELQNQNIFACVLPPVHYVVTDFSKDFPGTISVSKQSFQLLLRDIADSLHAQGVAAMCIVNSHLEPDHISAIHEFCNGYPRMRILFPDKTRKPWASLLTEEFKKGACHAGAYETSLVLSARADLVSDIRKQLPPNPVNLAQLMRQGVRTFREAHADRAYFGDPASASVQEGEETYAILVQMVVETILQHLKATR
jgi:creatinine amidohydrolase